MKKEKVGVKVVPDNRRKKDEERFPLKLRITYKGRRTYYGIGHDATREEWEIINSAEAKGTLRKIKNKILTIENDALECCEKITPFSFKYFEHKFFDQRTKFETLQSTYETYIRELKNNDQYGLIPEIGRLVFRRSLPYFAVLNNPSYDESFEANPQDGISNPQLIKSLLQKRWYGCRVLQSS